MKNIIANHLLTIKAIYLSLNIPFVWASGIKSPIYCDNRVTLSDHVVRTDIENGLAEIIRQNYPDCEVIMGTSTAGIAHAAITAHILGLPMGYVRSGNKGHGRGNRIEGKLLPGQKVVVIEDLISTAGSVLDTVEALKQEGGVILGIASIFTYGMLKGIERLEHAGVKNISLTDFDTIIEVACKKQYIRPKDKKRLLAFRDNPQDESWITEQGDLA